MTFELNSIFSLTVGIGAIIGWTKIKKIDPAYMPFLILLGVSFLHEIFSIYITKAGYSNVISYNIFSLAEALLIGWQFKKWGLFDNNKTVYHYIQGIFISGWLIEVLIKGGLTQFNSYYIICYSAIIILLSINMLNRIMFKEPSFLFYNAVFLICMGMVIYFTYAILIEAFWLYGLNGSRVFRVKVYEILAYINLITNLVFAIATIWIPMKQHYIMQYS